MDWELVAEVAGGGFGVTVLVLMILAALTLIMGIITQKIGGKKEAPPKRS